MDKYDLINEIKIHPLVRGIMFPYGRYIKYRERKIYKGSIYPDKLRKYKSIHKGKRCFIIGNGPSLTGSDLDLIKEEITFASNKIFNIYEETSWRPTYYVCTDHGVLDHIYKDITMSKAVENFIDIWGMKYDSFFQNVLYINAHPTFVINMYGYNNSYIPKDIAEGFSTGFTVSFTMIQLAIYMGFEEIYLLGHDFSMQYYKDKWAIPHKTIERNAHFGKNYSTKKTYLIKYSNLQSFLHAKEYCDRNNIIIKNARQ